MQLKKIKSIAVASAIVLSMVGVASATDFFETYPNLTTYNTPYTSTVTKDGTTNMANVELKVQGASSDWYSTSPFDLTNNVGYIKWSMVDGSNTAVSIDNENSIVESVNEGYVAKKTATVNKAGNPGIAVVEAKNTKEGYTDSYMDFTVVVNPNNDNKVQTISNVNVRAYDKTSGSFDFLKSANGTVNTDTISSSINYPSAMDAIKLVADDNGYTYGVQYGTEFLQNVTINGSSYKYENNNGWMYAVYNESGNLVGISEKVGAETFDVKSGYTVVWAYVNGYDAGFPSTLSSLPTE